MLYLTERVWEEAMPPTDGSTKKLKKETLPGLTVGLLSGRVQVSACRGQSVFMPHSPVVSRI